MGNLVSSPGSEQPWTERTEQRSPPDLAGVDVAVAGRLRIGGWNCPDEGLEKGERYSNPVIGNWPGGNAGARADASSWVDASMCEHRFSEGGEIAAWSAKGARRVGRATRSGCDYAWKMCWMSCPTRVTLYQDYVRVAEQAGPDSWAGTIYSIDGFPKGRKPENAHHQTLSQSMGSMVWTHSIDDGESQLGQTENRKHSFLKSKNFLRV